MTGLDLPAEAIEAAADAIADNLGWEWVAVPAEFIPSSKECTRDAAEAGVAGCVAVPAQRRRRRNRNRRPRNRRLVRQESKRPRDRYGNNSISSNDESTIRFIAAARSLVPSLLADLGVAVARAEAAEAEAASLWDNLDREQHSAMAAHERAEAAEAQLAAVVRELVPVGAEPPDWLAALGVAVPTGERWSKPHRLCEYQAKEGWFCNLPFGHPGGHFKPPVAVPPTEPAGWCYCYETPEPAGNWVFPDDEHADNHSLPPTDAWVNAPEGEDFDGPPCCCVVPGYKAGVWIPAATYSHCAACVAGAHEDCTRKPVPPTEPHWSQAENASSSAFTSTADPYAKAAELCPRY